MRSIIIFLIAAVTSYGILAVSVFGDVNIGITADEDGVKEFHLAIGDFYKSSDKQVAAIAKNGINNEELAVVFFLAEQGHVSPKAIIDLRSGGKSWFEISLHLGLKTETYFIEVHEANKPPYGKALGHFKKKPKSEWNEIRLGDDDIINLVNLKFLSKHYNLPPDEIIKMKSNGESFTKINFKAKKSKNDKNDNKTNEKQTSKNKKAPKK